MRRDRKLRRHSSGLAFVEIDGHRRYLGRCDAPETLEAYHRLMAELAAAPKRGDPLCRPVIEQVLAAFYDYAESHYVKNGKPTGELLNIKAATRPLRALYTMLRADEFGPIALKTVRNKMIDAGLSRGVVNQRIGVIRRIFRWAVEQELVPPSVWHGLQAVRPLQKDRTRAHETVKVGPVTDAVVDATLPFVPPVVADMVRFQRLTGCRPGEVCNITPGAIDRGGDVWAYRPSGHKMEHLGRERVIFIGPKAQSTLTPYLLRPADAFCFSPAESERRRKEELKAARKSKVTPSQQRRARRANLVAVADRYSRPAYTRAIHRAVERANVARLKEAAAIAIPSDEVELLPGWSPNRLRHSAATEIRRRFGGELARVVLGHSDLQTTAIYAERDLAAAAEVMRQLG